MRNDAKLQDPSSPYAACRWLRSVTERVVYHYHLVFSSATREKLKALLGAMRAYAATQKISGGQLIVEVDALWLT
jgi:hypothetical protein